MAAALHFRAGPAMAKGAGKSGGGAQPGRRAAMSYDTERSKEQLRRFETPIGNFIGRYRKQRPTFILFPGGMGSQLTRATEPFHHDLRRFDYATVWLDWTILDDAANQMQMRGDEDSDENIIISDGALSLFGFTPYDRFLALAR